MNCTNYQDITVGQGRVTLLGASIKIYLYIVDGVLFDTGPSRIASDTKHFFSNNQIEQVVLTHVHEDHSGMADWLQEKYNIPVYLHPKSLNSANKHGKYPLYRHMTWGNRKPFNAEAMPQQISTEKYTFDVIDAAGHSSAHNVFYEKNQGWLFTGDLYLGTRQIVAFKDEDMSQTISTLQELLKLDYDTILCAHSGVWEGGKKLLQEKLEYLQELQSKVHGLREKGMNNRQIDKTLFRKKPPITYISWGEWSSLNMVDTF